MPTDLRISVASEQRSVVPRTPQSRRRLPRDGNHAFGSLCGSPYMAIVANNASIVLHSKPKSSRSPATRRKELEIMQHITRRCIALPRKIPRYAPPLLRPTSQSHRLFSTSFTRLNDQSPPSQSDASTFKKKNVDRRSIEERMSLKGKTTVVTGGARGIGLSIVKAAARSGSDIAILDVLKEPQMDISKLGVNAEYYRTDVTNMSSLQDTFGRIKDTFGHIDNCVPAAAIVKDGSFFDHGWDECERLLKVNVMGSFFCAQLAAKAMMGQRTGGSIVFFASMASHIAIPLQRLTMYGATKGAIRTLTKQMAVELAPFNIRVNSISPGFIRTDMTELCAVQQPELYAVFNSSPPIGRMGETTDITGAVNYLLSDASAYTTGIDLPVDGAMVAGSLR